MRRAIERIVLAIATAFAAFALPAASQASTTTFTAPYENDVMGCDGDMINLTGDVHGVITATLNSGGGAMFATHVQPQGIAGVDLQTGTTYRGTGLTMNRSIFAPSGTTTLTFIDLFHIQATAGAESLDVSVTVHITALADGTVTAFVDNSSASC